MRIGLIGDLHGNPDPVDRWIRIVEPDFCIQVGDYWCYDHAWSVPMYWMFGNHERGDYIRRIIDGTFDLPTNSHWMMGGVEEIYGIRVMALPGLPQQRLEPGPAGYPPLVYELCEKHVGDDIDIFASHGCGFPFHEFMYDASKGKSRLINFEEMGITDLISRCHPTYAVSGHNHRFAIEEQGDITCIRLGDTRQVGRFAHLVELE